MLASHQILIADNQDNQSDNQTYFYRGQPHGEPMWLTPVADPSPEGFTA